MNRRSSWRKATLKAMTNDLFTFQRIETTTAKAKALRIFAEPLITLAKNNPDSVAARRNAFSKLCNRSVVTSLFNEIAPLYKDTPGGYTRIMPLGNRRGDGAKIVIIELTKRTISDDTLLGITKRKHLIETKKKIGSKQAKEEPEKGQVAPKVGIQEKEERTVEDVRKSKARTEQEKLGKKGVFRKWFRRKSIG